MSRQLLRARASRFSTEGGTGNISVPASTSLSGITAGTMLMLVNLANVANTGRFVMSRRSGGNGFEWAKRAADGTSMSFTLDRPTTDLSVIGLTGMLVAGRAQWAAVTWDSTTLANCRCFRAEVDGPMMDWTNTGSTVVGVGAVGSDAANLTRMFNNFAGTGGWPGTLQVMAIWRRVLSLQELDTLRRRGLAAAGCAGLWYPGEEGNGSIVEDWSGHRNHATVNNTLTLQAALPVPLIHTTGAAMRRVA